MIARRTRLAGFVLGVGVVVLAGACGSSSSSSSTAGSSAGSAAGSGSSSAAGAAASGSSGASAAGASSAPTIGTGTVPGLGTVLANGSGQTLYILTSEAGGKITCTDASGCTKFWPDNELPAGVTHANAGTGIQANLLGTTKSDDGKLYVTYAGYPVYTFFKDSGPGMANGQGVKSFGGTWEAMSPAGTPIAPGSSSSTGSSGATTPATTPASSSGGYGY